MSRKGPSAQERAEERSRVRSKALSEADRRARLRDDTLQTIAARDAFVRTFVTANHLASYPTDPRLEADENRVVDYAATSLHDALAEEIGRVFTIVGRPPPCEPSTLAQWILTSYDAELASDVVELAPAAELPSRILAHLETMGSGAQPVEAASIARRAALLLLNRGRP